MNELEVQRLFDEKQFYFLPYYEEVVSNHPDGIDSSTVKTRVRELIQQRHDFDPFEAELFGKYDSGLVTSTQWARNLISNYELDKVMIVDRQVSPRLLTPRVSSTSGIATETTPPWPTITAEIDRALGRREPRLRTSTTTEYARIPAVAEFVRQRQNYICIVHGDACSVFTGRNDRPYVEAHHIYPMRCQENTEYNLDRSENMVALCTACHAKLHYGSAETARNTMCKILDGYRTQYGMTHANAMDASGLNCDLDALLALY